MNATLPPLAGDTPWRWVTAAAGEPAANMALDDALHEQCARLGHPVLRFYGWTAPAATFGYSQHIAALEQATLLRPLIRRPTGGGLVPHHADWTYSLVFPPDHPWAELKAEASYQFLHAWIQASFTRLGEPTELAPCCHKEIPGQCFAGAEKHDLLWHGRKIAGAAQRRNRHGLLIQGSVQPPPPCHDRLAWEQAMRQTGTDLFGPSWLPWTPDAPVHLRAQELARLKYSQDAYNRKR